MVIATLMDKSEICVDTFEFTFSLQESVVFEAGGYFRLHIPLFYTDQEGNSRKFSFVNLPQDSKMAKIAFRKGRSGYKLSLQEMKTGDHGEVGKIKSKLPHPDHFSQVTFIAGGIGITPFMSMLSDLSLSKSLLPLTLLYFNKTQSDAAYLEKLYDFKKNLINLQVIPVMTREASWQGEKGRLSLDILQKFVPKNKVDAYYVVGTPSMVEDAKSTLLEWGAGGGQIFLEDFEGYENRNNTT